MSKKNSSHAAKRAPAPQNPLMAKLLAHIRDNQFMDVRICARTLLQTSPNDPFLLKALSFALIGLDQYDEAIGVAQRAIGLEPKDAELYRNVAVAYANLARYPDAEKYFLRAIEHAPKNYDYHRLLGTTYQAMHRLPEAIAAAAKAIELHPGNNTEAVELLARVLMEGRQYEHALPCLRELCEFSPKNTTYRLKLIRCSLKLSDWSTLTEDIKAYRASLSSRSADIDAPFGALTFPGLTRSEHRLGSTAIAAATLQGIRNHSPQVPLALSAPAGRKRLRVGYLSPDFRDHPVGNVIGELLERHDREDFEVFGYAITADSSSVRRRIEQAFEHFEDLSRRSTLDAVSRIRADDLDLLVDLGGWTTEVVPEIPMHRCARVQANWLGFPGTMGCREAADYLIGDATVTPLEHADAYTETIAQKAGCYLPFDTTTPVGAAPSRRSQNLPEDALVFGSHNNNGKFNPAVFDLWCKLLTEIDGGVLWLSAADPLAEANLRSEAQRRGIAPERIIFAARASHADHLARLQLIDVALDPFPYNSHSAGLAMLWAGAPLVCLRGETFAGRVGASMLTAIGQPDLIADSIDEYAAIALELARNKDHRTRIRQQISQARSGSLLFDMAQFTRDLEQLYRKMVAARANGEMAPISSGTSQSATERHEQHDSPPDPLPKASSSNELRLHIGGKKALPGWKILNIQPGPFVDHVGDIRDLSQFADGAVSSIYASHVLEHVEQKNIEATLGGIARVLKPGGKFYVAVPDLEVLCKIVMDQSAPSDAKIHAIRMMFGGQTDDHDYHYFGWTEHLLSAYLQEAGFRSVRRVDSFGLFDDTSEFKPRGLAISLNVIAEK